MNMIGFSSVSGMKSRKILVFPQMQFKATVQVKRSAVYYYLFFSKIGNAS